MADQTQIDNRAATQAKLDAERAYDDQALATAQKTAAAATQKFDDLKTAVLDYAAAAEGSDDDEYATMVAKANAP